ncbi:methyltransferase [Vulcanisaeta souniana]|uniref:RNA methyltransferase n=2 Tax=Vulcanisaeta souniana TaxID=164452 RepID=A0A830E3T5_9CREN|nr:methyltransferase [Vulcanisaeta souniana]BDR90913.1 RNA methyltransferase [Vulcanisaeta souniana JCM 11219]GGI79245.1 RNA methyltransferase [Vulcanisaeta souniana JCM 11219]
MLILLTTVPGIEDLVIEEIKERFGNRVISAEVFGSSRVTGKVLVNINDVSTNDLRQLRTVEHIILVLDSGITSKDINGLRKCIWNLNLDGLPNYYTPNTTIGVTVDRTGTHDYKSPETAALLGERISEFLLSKGIKPIFNLDNADLILRLIIEQDKCILGLSMTRRTLKDRPYRVFNHPASINPILANAMLRTLGPNSLSRVCDVTCGSGTIVIEGALTRQDLSFLCADIDYSYVNGAIMNARNAGVDALIDFVVMDSTRPALREHACHNAVFNPPFGIRIEPMEGIASFYDSLFNSLNHILRNGSSFVLITVRKSIVRRLVKRYGFRLINERVVEQGGIWSSIFKVVKE